MKKGTKRAGTSFPKAGVKTVDVRVVDGSGKSSEGLVLTYIILLKVSEVLAEDDGRVHVVYCSRGG